MNSNFPCFIGHVRMKIELYHPLCDLYGHDMEMCVSMHYWQYYQANGKLAAFVKVLSESLIGLQFQPMNSNFPCNITLNDQTR